MTRYEFLKNAGFTGGALLALLTSCVKEEDTFVKALSISPPENTAFPTSTEPSDKPVSLVGKISTDELNKISNVKLTLMYAQNAELSKSGGYVVKDAIVVAVDKSGSLLAASTTCTHESRTQVIFLNEEWFCTAHAARFAKNGTGLNLYGRAGVEVYKVATDGVKIVIY